MRDAHSILKAGLGLGHGESPEIQRLSFAFFEYALAAKEAREARRETARKKMQVPDPKEPPVWTENFQRPPYVGDFLNHLVYPAAQITKVRRASKSEFRRKSWHGRGAV